MMSTKTTWLILVVWLVCTLIPDSHQHKYTEKEIKYFDAVKAVYNLTIYGVNNYVIETGDLPDIFNPDVTGRVYDFAIKRAGPLEVAEYFYGLTPNDYTYESVSSVISRVDFNYFVVQDNVAYSSINYVSKSLATGEESATTQLGRWRFDSNDKIKEIDNVQTLYDISIRTRIPEAFFPFYQENVYNQTCTRHSKNCLGANQQFDSYEECDSFLRVLPFGTPDLNTWNSTICRWWHSHLTYLRPEVHCNHVGPSGGSNCVDFTLDDLFDPFFPNDKDRLIGPSSYVSSISATGTDDNFDTTNNSESENESESRSNSNRSDSNTSASSTLAATALLIFASILALF